MLLRTKSHERADILGSWGLCLERAYPVCDSQSAELIRLRLRLARIRRAPHDTIRSSDSAIDRPMATMPYRLTGHVAMAGW
ncbi:hypothetical protein [Sphingomonas sp.]|uniref:hypothetical protein n=1 Tax=Sphingomonas sp. TaxID=28214 RepID=UPI003B3B7961